MSKIKNPTDLSGLLGEEVSVRKLSGRVVVKNRPAKSSGPPTEKQEEVRSRFLRATRYAKWQMSITEEKADYEMRKKNDKLSAYAAAVADFLVAPVVLGIESRFYKGLAGDVIRIDATDDFRVTRVFVSILGADGSELESGDAVQHPAEYWEYKAKTGNSRLDGTIIKVTAFDKPGNTGTMEKVI